MEIVRSAIIILVEILCYNLFFGTFLEKSKLKTWVRICIISILFIIHFGLACIYIIPIRIILVIFSTAVAMRVLYNGKFSSCILLSTIIYGVVLLTDGIVFTWSKFMIDADNNYVWNDPMSVLPVISNALAILIVFIVRMAFGKKEGVNQLSKKEWAQFMVYPLLVSAIVFPMVLMEAEKVVIICLLCILLMEFLFFSLLQSVLKRENQLRKEELSKVQMENQLEQYTSREMMYEKQKQKLHDFQNHILCVRGLLKQERYEEAAGYLEDMQGDFCNKVAPIETNHPVINSILRSKLELAADNRILVVLDISDMGSLSIRNEDIVVIVTNLLDNAIEACMKLKSEQRKIVFCMDWVEKQLIISTQNPTDSFEGANTQKSLFTTKEDVENHGYGLQNIHEVAIKYQGEDIISNRNGLFTHTVILNIGVGKK